RTEGRGPDRVLVHGEIARLEDHVEPPQTHGVVGAGAGEQAAGGVEGQGTDLAVVSLEGAGRFAALRVVEVNDAVAGADEHRLAVLAEGQTGEVHLAARRGRTDDLAGIRDKRGGTGQRRVVKLERIRTNAGQRPPVRAECHK